MLKLFIIFLRLIHPLNYVIGGTGGVTVMIIEVKSLGKGMNLFLLLTQQLVNNIGLSSFIRIKKCTKFAPHPTWKGNFPLWSNPTKN